MGIFFNPLPLQKPAGNDCYVNHHMSLSTKAKKIHNLSFSLSQKKKIELESYQKQLEKFSTSHLKNKNIFNYDCCTPTPKAYAFHN